MLNLIKGRQLHYTRMDFNDIWRATFLDGYAYANQVSMNGDIGTNESTEGWMEEWMDG